MSRSDVSWLIDWFRRLFGSEPMSASTIYLVNRSTLVSNDQLHRIAIACNTQLRKHLLPAWGLTHFGCVLSGTPPQGARVITVLDTLDEADALGWHSDNDTGAYGVAGVRPTLDAGGKVLDGPYSVASIVSHEVCELAVDPACTSWSDSGRGFLVCTEVCDPVQSDAYLVNGVSLSNFVYPAYFDQTPLPGTRLDHLGKLSVPFSLATGGYFVKMIEGRTDFVFNRGMPLWLKTAKLASPVSRTNRRADQAEAI